MSIEELKKLTLRYLAEPIEIGDFEIEKKLIDQDPEKWKKEYYDIIQKKVNKLFGVYVLVDTKNNEIVYIGMAGQLKTNGKYGGRHTIRKRLTASRGKHKITKIDIPTSEHIRENMDKYNIETLKFYIFYTKKEEPPAYVEALLLYKFYKKYKKLPKLNKSF